jgi:hypothetical protein
LFKSSLAEGRPRTLQYTAAAPNAPHLKENMLSAMGNVGTKRLLDPRLPDMESPEQFPHSTGGPGCFSAPGDSATRGLPAKDRVFQFAHVIPRNCSRRPHDLASDPGPLTQIRFPTADAFGGSRSSAEDK